MASTQDLMTVDNLISGARTLLLDKIQPYRYDDNSLVMALNLALLEASRMRPDLFLCKYGTSVPQFDTVSGAQIGVEPQFRLALEYYTAGHALLRDQEDVQDERATTLLTAGESILIGARPARVQGGTPSPKSGSGGTNQA